MIIQEHVDFDGRDFVRTASDAGRYVVRDGVSYEEAYDPAEFGRTYNEGAIIGELPTVEDKAEAYDILTGVSE